MAIAPLINSGEIMLKKKKLLIAGMAIALLTGLGAMISAAQQSGIKRTILIKQDLSVEGKEVVMGQAEIAPGSAAGKHYHYGEEVGYVLEGESVLEIEGQTPITLKAGQSYSIPAGKAHDARAVGETPAKVLAVYIVAKGKPLAVAVK
jgi:quercetin dioxygenase-like cupin family protein